MTSKVAKLQRACLRNPVKVEVSQKYQTVKTLKEHYMFIPAMHKVSACVPRAHSGISYGMQGEGRQLEGQLVHKIS